MSPGLLFGGFAVGVVVFFSRQLKAPKCVTGSVTLLPPPQLATPVGAAGKRNLRCSTHMWVFPKDWSIYTPNGITFFLHFCYAGEGIGEHLRSDCICFQGLEYIPQNGWFINCGSH